LKVYRDYVRNYETSLNTINHCLEKKPKFAQFLVEAKKNSNNKLDLQSFLIMPVQRGIYSFVFVLFCFISDFRLFLLFLIFFVFYVFLFLVPRYLLLMKDLFKHTWPDHPDYENLKVKKTNKHKQTHKHTNKHE